MRKLLMIGIMLLIVGCNPTTLKEPLKATFVNYDLGSTLSGPVNFNYQTEDRELIGKWAVSGTVTEGRIEDLHGTQFCISAESFFTVIVPTLKRGHDDYFNWKNRNN